MASPGAQRTYGPHGITLLAHARAGGDRARAVVAYLTEVGGADERLVSQALTAQEIALLVGTYAYGPGPTERVAIDDNKGQLGFAREGATKRMLFHLGAREFSPAGAPAVRIRFTIEGGRAMALTIHDPDPVLTARRV